MSERPILFSAPMVRAILSGSKTQTRRVLKPQPVPFCTGPNGTGPECEVTAMTLEGGKPRLTLGRVITAQKVTRWAPGDRLWVRETIWQAARYPSCTPSGEPEPSSWLWGQKVHYTADGDPPNCPNKHYPDALAGGLFSAPDPYAVWLKRPSIHMPRWASRITLAVEAVRVERLQDISEGDAIAEGMVWEHPTPEDCEWHRQYCEENGTDPESTPMQGVWIAPGTRRGYGRNKADRDQPHWHVTARDAFSLTWRAIHGPDAWDANPWVSVTTFRRVEA